MKSVLSVGVIGKNNQAARHIALIQSLPGVKLHSVLYHKAEKNKSLPITTRLADLLGADAIILSSPTPTHASYLKKLSTFKGYVLVEKPAVSTESESKALRRWSQYRKKKTRINFNLLYSPLAASLGNAIKTGKCGRLIALDIHTSQGLAFKPSYRNNWRSSQQKSLGVAETVGIHYVNLILTLFGQPDSYKGEFLRVAEWRKGPPDTAVLNLSFKSGFRVTLRHSYAAPMRNHWFLLGTNGMWEYDGQTAKQFSPRDTFDSSGRFVPPPVIKKENLDFPIVWKAGLKSALIEFLSVVRRGGSFSSKEFDSALSSMELIRRAARKPL